MIRAFALSLGDFADAAIARIFLKSIALTLLVLATLGVAVWFATRWLVAQWLQVGDDWAALAGVAELAATLAFGWLLFRMVAIAVIQLFGDEIVIAVERRHYPEALAAARRVPFARSLTMGLASAGRALLINLMLVPAYIVLLLTGVGTPLLFFATNGWLLGVDLGEMVAVRHVPKEGMRAWRGSTRWSRLGMGLIVSGLLTVPGINLFAPILGAAMAAHLFHGRKQ
jgi:CysZ protein